LAFGFGHDAFFKILIVIKCEGNSKEISWLQTDIHECWKNIGGANIYPQGIQNYIDRGFDKFLKRGF